MANNSQVAYRIVWGKTDANDNKIIGAPSQRFTVGNNSGGTRDVSINFTIPAGITVTHFYQVYRSGQTASIADEPNDELQLVVEKNPTAGEITAGSVTYVDSTPDTLRGTTLYTSPSQQGIDKANEAPPLSKDVVVFKDCVFYINTKSKQRLFITLIAVGGSGFVIDDTITIAGVTYTGKAAENVALAQFEVYTAGTSAENIDVTAKSLVKVINRYVGTTSIYAYYITGFDDLPGQILIEERTIAGAAYVAISSRGSAFSPPIPASGTDYESGSDTKPNGVYISKPNQPEAVPLLDYVYVGSSDKEIVRAIALRDSIFILKDDGVYRITGETIADFRVSIFDSTTNCIASESAVAINNQVFCFALEGIANISDSGVSIMSRPIERQLLQLSSEQYTNFSSVTHAIAYDSDRKYILFTVDATTDTYPTNAFVYNYVTNTWTRWLLPMGCGIVSDRDNKLYLGSGVSTDRYVYQERKNYLITDYADHEFAVNITSSLGNSVFLTSTTGILPFMSLSQISGGVIVRNSIINYIISPTEVTVQDSLSWTAGAATVSTPIPAKITYAPIHGGNPASIKHFSELITMFSDANFYKLRYYITTDISISNEFTDVFPIQGATWGLFPWGYLAWGGLYSFVQSIRTYFPAEKNMANWVNVTIEHVQALSTFAMVGMAVVLEEISTRRH
jgi:hypothetical protein